MRLMDFFRFSTFSVAPCSGALLSALPLCSVCLGQATSDLQTCQPNFPAEDSSSSSRSATRKSLEVGCKISGVPVLGAVLAARPPVCSSAR